MRRDHLPALLTALCATVLTGCAGVAWERAIYEGWRNTNQRAAPRDGAPTADGAAHLPRYEDYERERQRARTEPASAVADATPAAPAPAASDSGPAPR